MVLTPTTEHPILAIAKAWAAHPECQHRLGNWSLLWDWRRRTWILRHGDEIIVEAVELTLDPRGTKEIVITALRAAYMRDCTLAFDRGVR